MTAFFRHGNAASSDIDHGDTSTRPPPAQPSPAQPSQITRGLMKYPLGRSSVDWRNYIHGAVFTVYTHVSSSKHASCIHHACIRASNDAAFVCYHFEQTATGHSVRILNYAGAWLAYDKDKPKHDIIVIK